MNDSSPELVTVKILGREYKLRCQPGERDALIAAGQHLDNEMRAIRDTGNIIGMERIAIMAGLNIAHELIQTQTKHVQSQHRLAHRILQLNDIIDNNLRSDENSDTT